MRKIALLAVLGALLLATAACSGSAATGGGPSEPAMVTLTLFNDSSFTVCYVQISPAEEEMWGEDWLSADETIAPGESRDFEVSPGSYDLRALDCDQEVLDIQENVAIDEAITWTLTDI